MDEVHKIPTRGHRAWTFEPAAHRLCRLWQDGGGGASRREPRDQNRTPVWSTVVGTLRRTPPSDKFPDGAGNSGTSGPAKTIFAALEDPLALATALVAHGEKRKLERCVSGDREGLTGLGRNGAPLFQAMRGLESALVMAVPGRDRRVVSKSARRNSRACISVVATAWSGISSRSFFPSCRMTSVDIAPLCSAGERRRAQFVPISAKIIHPNQYVNKK